MHEQNNILRIFKETKEAVSKGDSLAIKVLSNQTTNTAALTHDPDNIAAAVSVYSLSKIVERESYYKKMPGWDEFYKKYLKAIDNIILALEKNNEEVYRQNIEIIQKEIEKLSGKLKGYVEDIFRKARINKASKIHEHGISMEKTASLLGITMYELASYIGEKDFSDETENSDVKETSVKVRLKNAMEMFE